MGLEQFRRDIPGHALERSNSHARASTAQVLPDVAGTPDALDRGMIVKKILCPVDYSECSREALRVAVDLARAMQATLVLAHVWETPLWTTGYDVDVPTEVSVELRNAAQANLARWQEEARRLGAAEVATRFLVGTTWDEIVTAADQDRAIGMIVMGTHGHTGLKHALIGSVAERVVRHAPCPVLVVRASRR
jgi:nucleotide-binding universal stress UspA family protein